MLKAIVSHKALTNTFNALQQAAQVLITTTKILRQAIQLALIPKLPWKALAAFPTIEHLQELSDRAQEATDRYKRIVNDVSADVLIAS